MCTRVLRAVTRRAFKTSEQLAASEAARWKMARSRLGWHEKKPTATPLPGICTKPCPMGEARPRTTAPRKTVGTHAAADAAMECGMSGKVEEDSRPRKRAVVRTHRKDKVGFLG